MMWLLLLALALLLPVAPPVVHAPNLKPETDDGKSRATSSFGSMLHPSECATKIPKEIDIYSIDAYPDVLHLGPKNWPSVGFNGTAEDVRRIYTQKLYPNLQPHQTALLVPPGYSCSDQQTRVTSCGNCTAVMLEWARYFWSWAQEDTRVSGIMPWHLHDLGSSQDTNLGAANGSRKPADLCNAAMKSDDIISGGTSMSTILAPWVATAPQPPPQPTLRYMSMFGLGNASLEAPLEASWVTHWQGVAGDCNEAPGVQPKRHPDRCPVDQGQVAAMKAVHAKYQIPGTYTELPGCGGSGPGQKYCGNAVWHRNEGNLGKGLTGLDDNWLSNLRAIVDTLRPAVQSGSINGVFLGDELVCHGVPYSNLSSVARELRVGLGPKVLLIVNDCGHSYTWSGGVYGWPAIPPELDLISADVYNATNGTAEAEAIIALYERYIIPKLGAHQQAVFVPGTFGCGPKFGPSFDEQQDQVVTKLELLFSYAKSHPKIGGFIGWHMLDRPTLARGNCPHCRPVPTGKCDMNYNGAASMPKVLRKLQDIGRFIRNNAASSAQLKLDDEQGAVTDDTPVALDDCVYAAHDWNAVTMHAVSARTKELCCAVCQKTPPCAAAILDAAGQCYLKTQLKSATACSNCTSCLATAPPHPSPPPPPSTPSPCGFYMEPCGSFSFPTSASAPFRMEIDPVTLGLRNLTHTSKDGGGRQQGFLQPSSYYSKYYKKTIELREQPMWSINVSDCTEFVPNGHRTDASANARNRTYHVGHDGVLRLRWEGVSLPSQLNTTKTLNIEVEVTPSANQSGLSLRASVSLASEDNEGTGRVCLQALVLPQITAWLRSNATDNMFIPDNFGHTGNCNGMCKMNFKQDVYDTINGVTEYGFMPQGGDRTMQWWAVWSNFTAVTSAKPPSTAIGLFAGFLDPIGYMKLMLAAGRFATEPAQMHAFHFPNDVTTELGSNPYSMPYSFLLQGFESPDLATGWYDAALLYRKWVIREATWMAPGTLHDKVARNQFPRWLLETPLWVQLNPYAAPCYNRGKYTCMINNDTRSCCRPGNNIENVLRLRQTLGVPIAAFWGGWNTEHGNTKNPVMTPNARFTADAKRLEDADVRVVPYTNGRILDPSVVGRATIGSHPTDYACHSSVKPNKIYREIYSGYPYNVSYYVMDPATEYWQDILANLASNLTATFALSGVYIDQISSMYAEPCFNRIRRGTVAEGGGGQFGTAWSDGVRAVYEKATSRMGAATHALFSEAQAEPYIGQISGNMALYGWKRCRFVPAFQVVYGGYTTMSGIMGWPYPDHTDPTLTRFGRGNLPSWRAYLAYQLVYGSLLSWEEIEDIIFILDHSPKDRAFVKALCAFRVAHSEYFVHGRIIRPPRVLFPLPTFSMFGNYNLKVYAPCEEPLVVANVFLSQNGSKMLFAANHDGNRTVRYVASAEGTMVEAEMPPLSMRAFAL